MRDKKHFLAVSVSYGTRRARRTQVELMADIEGILLPGEVGAILKAKEAFFIHPLRPRNSVEHWAA